MYIQSKELTIRNATSEDADLLCGWWNDGEVMAHAGFPLGLGVKTSDIAANLLKDSDLTKRRLILEVEGNPVGEMSYTNVDTGIAEIGIKICSSNEQGKGYGRRFLRMLIHELFMQRRYKKIILDTNLKNIRAQHVYESLGFLKLGVRKNCFTDQVGQIQSAVDYELNKKDWINQRFKGDRQVLVETEHLLIRKFKSTDANDLFEYLGDEEVVIFEPYDMFTLEECKSEAMERQESDTFLAVELKASGKLIGNVYFAQVEPRKAKTYTLGYVFNRHYQGRGLATEAARAIVEYGFSHYAAHRIIAMCNVLNEPSWRLLERIGMRREALRIGNMFFDEGADGKPLWFDSYQYGVLENEWEYKG